MSSPLEKSPLEHLIRTAVRDLADDANRRPHPALAHGALARGQRRRRRRRTSLVASVGLVTLLALLIPYGLSGSRTATLQPAETPSSTATSGDGPIELVDGWIVLGNRQVWNRYQSRYVDNIDGEGDIIASPNGNWAARKAGQGQYNVVDLRTGALRQYQVTSNVWTPQWSPDGNRLLFTVIPKIASTFTIDMVIVDVTSATTSTHRVDTTGRSCVLCMLTWLPGGDEVALTLGRNVGEALPEELDGLQLYTLDGRPSRTLPVKGMPGGAQAWSPDGRYVVVQGPTGRAQPTELVEVATGAHVRWFDGIPMQVSWVDNDRLLVWSTNPPSQVTLTDIAGQPSQSWNVPAEIATTQTGLLPPSVMAHVS